MTGSKIRVALVLVVLWGCVEPAGDGVDAAVIEARLAELEAQFTPGLHTLMGEVGARHATLWFAGEAGNWPLADYVLHEIGELIDDVETLHPVYDGMPVAQLVGEMTAPALGSVDAAVDAGDRAAFVAAFDELTQSCNGCHIATERAALRIVRPTSPAVPNLEYRPQGP